MYGGDMDALAAVVMVLIALITLVGVVWVTQIVVRAIEASRSPRMLLDRRLARGEISTEEYYELESALRSSSPVRRPPPRRWLRASYR
jgi:uncharacterized membrane protein